MAATEQGRRLTLAHRRAQLGVRSAAIRDLQQVWRVVDPTDLSRTLAPFSEASTTIAQARNRQSAGLAARYIEDLRRAEAVRETVAFLLGEAPPREAIAGSLRGAAITGIRNARIRGFSVQAAASNGFVKASGTLSSLVLGGGREVLTETVESDLRAVGWMRVTGSDPCAWCASLAAQGPMRRGGPGAGELHAFHDHDACMVEPVYDEAAFEDRGQWPAESRRLRDLWDEATGGADFEAGGALEAFRRGVEARAKGRPLPKVDPTIGIEEF